MSREDDVLSGIKTRTARMSLAPLIDRRDHAKRDALVRRILGEFSDMPGMALSQKQAGRFLGVDDRACTRILSALTRDGHLRRNTQGLYVRADVSPRADVRRAVS